MAHTRIPHQVACVALGVLFATACTAKAPDHESHQQAAATASPTVSATASTTAPAPRFAPFDSLTLQAACDSAIGLEADREYRQAVAAAAGAPGVLMYAAPTHDRPCYQLGVASAELRDSLADVLRHAGVPLRAVTYLHVTHVPPDDIELGGGGTAR
ncbi:MAG TPA: hypothetical protein VF166_11505 [Gemmatimonadaceae bacterium]